MIQTQCKEQDIATYAVSFICESNQKKIRHVFEEGAFSREESVDTEIACDTCIPSSAPLPADGRDASVQYGPSECISLWRNKYGHCAVQTQCTAQEIQNYPVGFVCDSNQTNIKHVFEAGSFAPQEEFDTLIKCDRCDPYVHFLGRDGVPVVEEELDVLPEVTNLRNKLKTLTEGMVKQSNAIYKLNEEVFDVKQVTRQSMAGSKVNLFKKVGKKNSDQAKDEPVHLLVHKRHKQTTARQHKLQYTKVVMHKRARHSHGHMVASAGHRARPLRGLSDEGRRLRHHPKAQRQSMAAEIRSSEEYSAPDALVQK